MLGNLIRPQCIYTQGEDRSCSFITLNSTGVGFYFEHPSRKCERLMSPTLIDLTKSRTQLLSPSPAESGSPCVSLREGGGGERGTRITCYGLDTRPQDAVQLGFRPLVRSFPVGCHRCEGVSTVRKTCSGGHRLQPACRRGGFSSPVDAPVRGAGGRCLSPARATRSSKGIVISPRRAQVE